MVDTFGRYSTVAAQAFISYLKVRSNLCPISYLPLLLLPLPAASLTVPTTFIVIGILVIVAMSLRAKLLQLKSCSFSFHIIRFPYLSYKAGSVRATIPSRGTRSDLASSTATLDGPITQTATLDGPIT